MQKIRVKTLHQEVADQIRGMIRRGDLICGQKIDERALCETMGVSRTPVRESLRILHSEGLIELVPHKGAYVSKPRIEEVKDMFEVMGMLEGMCARLAVERMGEQDIQRIENLHERLERQYADQNREQYLDINHELHILFQELSGNKSLQDVINGLRQKILLYRHRQLYQKNRFEQSMKEHRDILEAFQSRDPERAENAMKNHMKNQCEALVDYYAEKLDEGAGALAA
ncbi:MAG: GntR family transcriptional regulator [Deltaproteobacteria bacterium]|nr:GntR family transcriptional regulator [Deltaproteobacteria bacterium]